MHMVLPNDTLMTVQQDNHAQLTLILIIIKDYFVLREMYGQEFTEQIERELKDTLDTVTRDNGSCNDTEKLTVESGEIIFLISQCTAPADFAYECKLKAQDGLKRTMFRQTGLGIDLGMGYSTLNSIPDSKLDVHFITSLEEARRMALIPLDMKKLSICDRFDAILANGQIKAHYQPILNFRTGTIIGWEALARGPKGSSFRSPVILFETAEQLGRLFALEKKCREAAIRNIGQLKDGQKLFLNIHPKTMADPEFTPGKTLELMEEAGLSAENIVFEITE